MWSVALKATWKQNFYMMRRYLFNTLSGFITLYIVFALLFHGTRAVGAGTMNLGDTLEGMFAGYVTWMLALMGCTDLAWNITNEAQSGTLEQLCLSPLGYKWVLVFNQSFTFFANFLVVGLITVSMSLTTGQAIHMDLVSVIPVVLAIYVQALGLGFVLAGLALIYKRIQAVFQIVQFALIGFFFVPFDAFPVARYLPLTEGRKLLQEVLMGGIRIWQTQWADLGPMLAATALYIVVGVACFAVAESKARSRGLLGQY